MTWAWRDANRAPTLFCKSVPPELSNPLFALRTSNFLIKIFLCDRTLTECSDFSRALTRHRIGHSSGNIPLIQRDLIEVYAPSRLNYPLGGCHCVDPPLSMMPWRTTHFSVSLFRNPRICQRIKCSAIDKVLPSGVGRHCGRLRISPAQGSLFLVQLIATKQILDNLRGEHAAPIAAEPAPVSRM